MTWEGFLIGVILHTVINFLKKYIKLLRCHFNSDEHFMVFCFSQERFDCKKNVRILRKGTSVNHNGTQGYHKEKCNCQACCFRHVV